MKHSPGPWHACGQSDGACVCGLIWSVPSDMPVVEVLAKNQEEGIEYPRDEFVANSRLVAAAPELLSALKETVSLLAAYASADGDSVPLQYVRQCDDLIRRIEGASE